MRATHEMRCARFDCGVLVSTQRCSHVLSCLLLRTAPLGIFYHNMAQTYLQQVDNDQALDSYRLCVKAKPHDDRCKQWAQNLEHASPKQKKPSSKGVTDKFASVPAVTDRDFDKFRRENPKVFVMFYAPWCSHCNEMKDEYAKVHSAVRRHVAVASMDCTRETDTCANKVFYRSLTHVASTCTNGVDTT